MTGMRRLFVPVFKGPSSIPSPVTAVLRSGAAPAREREVAVLTGRFPCGAYLRAGAPARRIPAALLPCTGERDDLTVNV